VFNTDTGAGSGHTVTAYVVCAANG
jgi:hypothetical protein